MPTFALMLIEQLMAFRLLVAAALSLLWLALILCRASSGLLAQHLPYNGLILNLGQRWHSHGALYGEEHNALHLQWRGSRALSQVQLLCGVQTRTTKKLELVLSWS